MNAFDHALFKDPTPEYASAYAWCWDAQITKEGIYSGLAMLKKAGLKTTDKFTFYPQTPPKTVI